MPSKTTSKNNRRPPLKPPLYQVSGVSEIPVFSAAEYLSPDPFTPSDSVPAFTESERSRLLSKAQGQLRAMEVATAIAQVDQKLLRLEGINLESQEIVLQNQARFEDLKTAQVKVYQSQTRTQIEEAKHTELTHDLRGQIAQATLKDEAWTLKLEGLRDDLGFGRTLLDRKRSERRQELSAQPELTY